MPLPSVLLVNPIISSVIFSVCVYVACMLSILVVTVASMVATLVLTVSIISMVFVEFGILILVELFSFIAMWFCFVSMLVMLILVSL